MDYQKEISENVIKGDPTVIEDLIQKAVEEIGIKKVLNGLYCGMKKVGERYKENELFIPEIVMSARTMQAGMRVLEPYLIKSDCESKTKIVIGTVKGDNHEIGKNLVAMLLRGAGYEVIDLGIDVSVQKFTDAVKEHEAQLVGLSTLLTTSKPEMAKTIEALRSAGLSCKTIVGGAAVTESYAKEIGADSYAPDASSAIDKARELLGV